MCCLSTCVHVRTADTRDNVGDVTQLPGDSHRVNMASKRKSPPLRIVSEDFLFPTKRTKNVVDDDESEEDLENRDSQKKENMKEILSKLFNFLKV